MQHLRKEGLQEKKDEMAMTIQSYNNFQISRGGKRPSS